MFRRRLSLLSGPDKLAALDSQGSSTLKKRLGRCSVAATVIHDTLLSHTFAVCFVTMLTATRPADELLFSSRFFDF